MREIRFRVWHRKSKLMYWFNLMWGNKGIGGDGWLYGVPWGDERTYSNFAHGDNREQLDPTECDIMQFTGLLDKRGREIYEGDILYLEFQGIELKGFVKKQDDGRWVLWKDEANHLGVHHNRERIEVIGNIYENPELLEVKE